MLSSRLCHDLSKDCAPSRALELLGEGLVVNTDRGEVSERVFGVATVSGHQVSNMSVVDERVQGLLWHGVDGERGGQRADVKRVGSDRILGGRAGPQQPLRAGSFVGQPSRAR